MDKIPRFQNHVNRVIKIFDIFQKLFFNPCDTLSYCVIWVYPIEKEKWLPPDREAVSFSLTDSV